MRNIVEKPIIYPKFLNLTFNKLLTPSNPFHIINIYCFQVLLKNTVRKLFPPMVMPFIIPQVKLFYKIHVILVLSFTLKMKKINCQVSIFIISCKINCSLPGLHLYCNNVPIHRYLLKYHQILEDSSRILV